MEEMYRERQSFDSRDQNEDQRGGKEDEDQNGEREDENDFLRYKSFQKRESERRSKQQLCDAARELVKM